jgi:hypothetical protein
MEIVKYLAQAEHRSCNQQVAQLIHEALAARQRKAAAAQQKERTHGDDPDRRCPE